MMELDSSLTAPSSSNYRTIFLMDASAVFRSTACGRTFELDVPKKNQNHPLLPPLSKSLYSCAVEALFEYCRIVWDLFPAGERAIKVSACLSDFVRPINGWEPASQNYQALHDAFGRLSSTLLQQHRNQLARGNQAPVQDVNDLTYLTNGFAAELDQLSSTVNVKADPSLGAANSNSTTNSARMIIITCLPKATAVILSLQEKIKAILEEHGQMSQESRASIKHLDVILLNTVPVQDEATSKSSKSFSFFTGDLPTINLAPNLSFTVTTTPSSVYLSATLTNMAFEHFDLASSTISGIPMKEEQNAGTSANYDVEIVHSRRVHTQFFASCVYRPVAADAPTFFANVNREGVAAHTYRTLILKWCTPKTSAGEVNNVVGAYRITAVDVNSRPSSCLINFLHTGKTVSLEMSNRGALNKNGVKLTSHMLQSLNGELYINVLNCTRTLLAEEGAPSISEGVGGRVTDYRVNELAELMRAHRLVRLDSGNASTWIVDFSQARAALRRATLYWPLSFGSTVFFNIRDAAYSNFYSLLTSRDRDRVPVTASEVADVRNLLYGLASNEAKAVPLSINTAVLRLGKAALKREDHYRILWLEMEHLLRCYARPGSSNAVLEEIVALFESIKPQNSEAAHLRLLLPAIEQVHSPSLVKSENEDHEMMVTSNGNGTDADEKRNGFGEQFQKSKKLKLNFDQITTSSSSLHSMFVTRVGQRNNSRRREFTGRLTADGATKAKLYKELLPPTNTSSGGEDQKSN